MSNEGSVGKACLSDKILSFCIILCHLQYGRIAEMDFINSSCCVSKMWLTLLFGPQGVYNGELYVEV